MILLGACLLFLSLAVVFLDLLFFLDFLFLLGEDFLEDFFLEGTSTSSSEEEEEEEESSFNDLFFLEAGEGGGVEMKVRKFLRSARERSLLFVLEATEESSSSRGEEEEEAGERWRGEGSARGEDEEGEGESWRSSCSRVFLESLI